ncbi:hypothetical protein [Lentzea sp. NBRC 105346]|uniref:hypothetical protein n=1 Tax=Lentzea sp. NBRC 105346 TaxID=3032205 RepID=UPI002557580D|nr:hypothetical protein [Lentzea sp. NBRC 105346]
MERFIADSITLELVKYDTETAIARQTDYSPLIFKHADIAFRVYETVVSTPGAVPEGSGDLAKALSSFQIGRTISTDETLKAMELEFLGAVRAFLALSLWVSAEGKPGQRLIASLAQTGKTITIGIAYKSKPSSLMADPNARGVHATAAPDAAAMTEQETEAQARDRLSKIVRGPGGESVITAPVYAGTLEDPTKAFKNTTVRDALWSILRGSVSFNQKGDPYFSPSRVELMHELIHVDHNARGENRADLPLNKQARDVWKDAEEFWTIEAGDLTESDFARDLVLPRRRSHSGLRLHAFDPKSADAQKSLKKHFEYEPD